MKAEISIPLPSCLVFTQLWQLQNTGRLVSHYSELQYKLNRCLHEEAVHYKVTSSFPESKSSQDYSSH